MLRFLRKKGTIKKIMWALAILIIPAFVLWGSGSAIRSKDRPKYAGKIFGKKVSFDQYEASFRACRNQALLIYGENIDRVAKYLDLEQEAWQRLILLYQAKKEEIKVSDKELIDFIKTLPLFQKDGRFNQQRYNMLVDYAFRTNPREFEEQIRGALILEKLKNKVIDKVALTDEEIEREYKKENEKARAFYVFFDPQEFKEQVHPSFEQLQQYHQSHQTEFKKPEQVNVQYIALYFDQDAPQVDVTEEEIEKAVLEERIWQISDAIADEDASFEDVAKREKLEVKETALFGPQQLIPEIGLSYEFFNSAFSLELEEISNPIETPKGYFIIKVKEKKQPYVPELDEIKLEVEAALIKQKSRELAKGKGEQTLPQIKKLMDEENLTFIKAAEELSLVVKETEEFSKTSYISGIGQSQSFSLTAFALQAGGASSLIEVPNGYCIVSLKEIIPIDEEKFAQEKEEFGQRTLARKKQTHYQIWRRVFEQKANLVNNIERLKEQAGP